MSLSDRHVFLSVRLSGAAASALRKLAIAHEATLVTNIKSAHIVVFPVLEDPDDPDALDVPTGALSVTDLAFKACLKNGWELPKKGILQSCCLRNCFVTTTGASKAQTSQIARMVRALGGQFSKDLDGQTTHLIVEVVGSDKHRLARLRQLWMVDKLWLNDCWELGQKLDEAQYPVKPLAGLSICVTGLSASERQRVEGTCSELGATFVSDLAGTSTTTYLLAGVAFGRKFEYAKQKGMRVLRLEWLTACRQKRELVDEQKYNLVQMNSSEAVPDLFLDCCCVHLKGADPQEERYLSRMLRSAGATRSPRMTPLVTHVIVGSAMDTRLEMNEEIKYCVARGTMVVRIAWLEACFRSQSLASESDFLALTFHKEDLPSTAGKRKESVFTEEEFSLSDVFRGLRIGIHQDEDLRLVIRGGGKPIRCNNDGNAIAGVPTHVVLEHGHSSGSPDAILVTRKWLKSCLRVDKLLNLSEDRLFRPVLTKLPIEAMKGLVVTVSGYYSKLSDGVHLRESIGELITLLGAKFSERMWKLGTTHLVCESASGGKFNRAKEWGIPCVTVEWLYSCATSGVIPDVNKFAVTEKLDVPDRSADTSTIELEVNKGDPPMKDTEDQKDSSNSIVTLARKYVEKPAVYTALRRSSRAAASASSRDVDRVKVVRVSDLDANMDDGDDDSNAAELSQAQIVTYRTSKKRRHESNSLDREQVTVE
mmetsp:Transcript_7046/g.21484  ORF Transcript_7046/g.21484 Transcript_7046/m.21484 type:complete len:707 (+) Transcript_7046:139-2259(+)|eukprot:CAMPEP_0198733588 /NCGR_PEP_ID=MMETSP1475-20131203/46769_1 /TAXON_ID= ORGANISM="Unidentified sp., Strain CCMP1999" /NCGR_SAMPLE_ID=MMETSP1475 /ASSEMBLY_ACC=CAM_ASM_001111 /LENGTH=706 /DNA_ID=CAMNT_0044496907 /DNA_START=58 /DNA_END=2178 /DNA_ORIENTATION=-